MSDKLECFKAKRVNHKSDQLQIVGVILSVFLLVSTLNVFFLFGLIFALLSMGIDYLRSLINYKCGADHGFHFSVLAGVASYASIVIGLFWVFH